EALGAARERALERGLPVDRAKFRGRRSMFVDANWKLVWDNNCECYHCPTVHANWYRHARLDPKHYFDRRIGAFHYETELQLYADRPSQWAYYAWPAVYFQSADANYSNGTTTERKGMLVLRFVPLGVRSTRVDADILHVDDLAPGEVERRLDQTFSVIEEDKGVCEMMQHAHDSGAAVPGTLLPGIDTEDHTLLWQRLIHRSIGTPDVPLYARLAE
ncbi:MAG TPA: RHO alpha subunit C-terminal catalytic domain-containing protein, partial [Pseudomonadales bacterium]